ncbi:Ribonuclease H-like superfamily [Sesbania bispinosa]|nr:Ribonuclease H-like superfamily [Sesbania bispinosa]
MKEWILNGVKAYGTLYLSTLWGIWKSRNGLVFEELDKPVWEIVYSAISFATVIQRSLASPHTVRDPVLVRWEAPGGSNFALNIDGSVMGNKAGFGGLVRNSAGEWLMGFFGHLDDKDILFTELMAILRGLQLCWDKDIRNIQCWSVSKTAVTLILRGVSHFHKYANF